MTGVVPTSKPATINGIDRVFEGLNGRAALILYITAGHPTLSRSRSLAPLIAEQADILEIGIPFSDPVADGPIIQASSQAALATGTHIEDCFELARLVSQQSDTPLVFLTYYNPVLQFGIDRFARECRSSGVQGVIAADVPPEESAQIHAALLEQNVYLIPLVAPTSTPDRLQAACATANGFIYCVSRTGVTGLQDQVTSELPEFLSRVRECTNLPRAVGFGISRPDHVRSVAKLAEGVIIGSALVDLIERTEDDSAASAIEAYVGSLRRELSGGA